MSEKAANQTTHYTDEPPETAVLADAESGGFRSNLERFGERAGRLSGLLKEGRISTESCFRALTQLWLQLARSRDQEPPGRSGRQLEQAPRAGEQFGLPHPQNAALDEGSEEQ